MKNFILSSFWVSLICTGLDFIIYGAMSGIAAVTKDKYWEDYFFKLGVDLGTFFLALTLVLGAISLILKFKLRKE
ncbi:hypothetical protein ABE402_16430 [Bacillus smithii]|uniref:hypothetical protein n=1 Tax=Bacillus smithii TaxID=1479 RepID=UPI003D24D1E7